MKKTLVTTLCVLSIITTHTLPAFAVEAVELKISRLGDVNMSCGQLSQEAALMRDIISTTEDIKDKNDLRGNGITAAGAIGSFLVGSVTGGVGLAAAGFLLKNETNEKKEEADDVQDIAEQRRSLMIGIYNAKGCQGPVEHAMRNVTQPEPGHTDLSYAAIEPASGDKTGEKPRYNQ